MAKKLQMNTTVQHATRIFTDRTAPRKVFWDKYQEICDGTADDINVISYYGIGGIGKSKLLRKIMAEMRERNNGEAPYCLLYDFEISQNPFTIWNQMKTRLEKDFGFSFVKFDLATYIYCSKIGEDKEKPEAKAYGSNKTISYILDLMGEVPELDKVAKIIRFVDNGLAILKDWKNQEIKTFLEEINELQPDEILTRLPLLFAEDFNKNHAEANQPFVFFFDTYEKIVNEINEIGYTLTKDLWLRGDNGLILNMPNVLWVIAGRNRLRWGDNDKDWEESLSQHRLGDLDKSDAFDFLEHCGVTESAIKEKIYETTNGTPLYLDLCVNTYEELKAQQKVITPDAFSGSKEELIERYVRYMDPNTKDLALALAVMGCWDDEVIEEVGTRILPNFSLSLYDNFKNNSSVYCEDNTYYLHKTVCEIFRKLCPDKFLSQVFDTYTEYLAERIDRLKKTARDYENTTHEERVVADKKEDACLRYRDEILVPRIRRFGDDEISKAIELYRDCRAKIFEYSWHRDISEVEAYYRVLAIKYGESDKRTLAARKEFAKKEDDNGQISVCGLSDIYYISKQTYGLMDDFTLEFGIYYLATLIFNYGNLDDWGEGTESDVASDELVYDLMDLYEVESEPKIRKIVNEICLSARQKYGDDDLRSLQAMFIYAQYAPAGEDMQAMGFAYQKYIECFGELPADDIDYDAVFKNLELPHDNHTALLVGFEDYRRRQA